MSDKEILFCVVCFLNNVEFTSQPVPQREAIDTLQKVQTLNGVTNAWMTPAAEIERLYSLKYADRRTVDRIVEDERRGQ